MHWWTRLFSRNRMRAELAQEVDSHLEERTAALIADGYSPAEAARMARRAFGNVHFHRERSAEQWQWPLAESLWADIRLAVYKLTKAPAYAAVAILTLSIGIGATTTIFTILDVAMLRSLPVRHPSELVSLGLKTPMRPQPLDGAPLRLAEFIRDHNASFSDISGWGGTMVAVRDSEGTPRSVGANLVTGNALPMLGVRAYLGRVLEPADDVAGGPNGGWPVVLDYGYWQSNFHGDTSIIGRILTVSEHPAVIVGVLPRAFQGIFIGSPSKLYLPARFISVLTTTPEQDPYLHPEGSMQLTLARLAPGVSMAQANAELMATTSAVWHDMMPPRLRAAPFMRGATLVVHSASRGFSQLEQQYGSALLMLQGIVLVVLLLCCVNLGGLQLARVQRHQHEYAIRSALGAGRIRILRQCLTESLLLAFAGSLLAAAIAWLATPAVGAFLTPAGAGESSVVRPDAHILLYTTVLSVATTLLFGLMPALRAGSTAPGRVLKGHGVHRRTSRMSRNILICGQFALALVLVFGAGLFTQTLSRLRSNHAGFEPKNVLMVTAQFQLLKKKPEEIALLYHLMTEKLRASSGVQSAAYTWATPLTGFAPTVITHSLAQTQNDHSISFNEVGDGYFATIGTRLLVGREFSRDDKDRSTCILNQSAASTFFGRGSALGESLKSEDQSAKWTTVCRVVGIAEDARYASLRDPAPATIYFPAGAPALAAGGYDNNFVFFLRAQNPADAMAAYRATLAQFVPSTTYMTFLPLQEQVDQSLGSERLISLLSSTFAGVALLLSGIGIFGLLALRVQQRTQEIGVRMALGANRSHVLRMVLGEAALMIATGTVIGIAIAAGCSVLVRRFLYGISSVDPWVATASVVLLFAVGIAAAAVPARRAARLNPMLSLRSE